MSEKTFPLSAQELQSLTEKYETPFYLYDEKAIRENIRRFTKAFSIFPGFKEHFAVKACPNPYILKILRSEGCGADCSSLPELILAENAGRGRGFLPEILSFRYNPGPLKEGNAIIGKPEEAKYGLTEEQIFEAYKICKEKGVKRFGLHTMVASNELNPDYFVETATLLFNLAAKVKEKVGITFEFINLGGGLGIPYKPGDKAVDYDYIARGIKDAYDAIVVPAGLDPLKIYWECGRPITGPYGWLVTRAIHEKHIYRDYIGVDASMADLMRPGMYGAYHEVTVSGKENAPKNKVYDVVGSLCENCDKFAVQRPLPEIVPGDLLIIHDAGAHGRAMGFNYNAKLRCGELLLRQDGSVVEIRRRETIDDYFATLDFTGLRTFTV